MNAPQRIADLLIIGGGINGTAIARDAAGRGLSVILCESQDLAEGTSSKSSKLIHGGLRYLEYLEFRLVREALAEREILMRTGPHVVWPQEFILPHTADLRPAWFVRLGLFIYDHLGGRRSLPGCRGVDLSRESVGDPIRATFKRAFSYWDCRSDDSRIVALNAVAARESGAEILTRTAYVSSKFQDGVWRITLRNQRTALEHEVHARIIVNAAGPWANGVLRKLYDVKVKESVRNVKGSHIVLPKIYEGDHAYFLQHHDKRILFVIPYERDFTLVGNTDVAFDGDPTAVEISPEEAEYMCSICSRYFKKRVDPADIVWTWSGLRPLFDDGQDNISAITRDYALRTYRTREGGPILSIFGGKITTGRQLAESAMKELRKFFPSIGPSWTHNTPFPGGDVPGNDFDGFVQRVIEQYPSLPSTLVQDYVRRYGTRALSVLRSVKDVRGLGRSFGGGLYEREVRYLMQEEFALTADDILWRRTKLGLRVPKEGAQQLEAWIRSRTDSTEKKILEQGGISA